ncbi:MAG: hypothetical protein ACPHP8_03975, partial [Luminiphilus sp.]
MQVSSADVGCTSTASAISAEKNPLIIIIVSNVFCHNWHDAITFSQACESFSDPGKTGGSAVFERPFCV